MLLLVSDLTTFKCVFFHCRSEKVYDSLVPDMISHDVALRAVVKNAELLLFTSNLLPFQFWSE